MDDLISRQAAIDALHMHLMYRMGTDSNKKRLDDWINGVPSVQPETTTVTIGRTKGGVVMWYECDACGESIDRKDCYCRNCGRKLTLLGPYRGGGSDE